MGSGGSTLTLLTGGELSQVTVVVTLPMYCKKLGQLLDTKKYLGCIAIFSLRKKHAYVEM